MYKLRTQKYYKIEIMERFMLPSQISKMIGEYMEVRNYPIINKRILQGHILEQIIDNFDEFKEDYEAAKSPTVNNLPRNKYKKTVQRQPKEQSTPISTFTCHQLIEYKLFGRVLLTKLVYDKR